MAKMTIDDVIRDNHHGVESCSGVYVSAQHSLPPTGLGTERNERYCA